MKAAQFWNINNVSSFRGFDVENGEVVMSDEEFATFVDEIEESVTVAGIEFSASDILQKLDPVAWRCAKSEEESRIQSELGDQLENEIADDIDFIEGEEDELEEDEE